MIHKSKIPTLIGIISLFIGIAAGVLVIRGRQLFRLGADETTYPTNIRVSNLSNQSVNISWTTDSETYGYVKYGSSPLYLDKTAFPKTQTVSKTHYLKLDNLLDDKKYYYVISSKGIDYDNENAPFEFTTAPKLKFSGEGYLIYGKVFSKSGQVQDNAIVYANVGGGSLLSTTTSEDGTWAILISSARTRDLKSFIDLDEKNTLIEIEAITDNNNISSVTTYPIFAKPIPAIILGKTYDYRQNPITQVEDFVPKSAITPPLNF